MRRTAPLTLLAILAASLRLVAAGAQGEPAPAADILRPDPGFAELGPLAQSSSLPSLEMAALLASGLAPDRLGPYLGRLDQILDGLKLEAESIADPGSKAEGALAYLHKTALRAYSADATTIDGILDTGLYNCVSSAVLYSFAVASLGLDVGGVRTIDHAFCTVLVDGRWVDVETTNPYGFDPGGRKNFKDSFGRVTGFAYVAPGGYGDRRAIGTGDLVGLILSNRASVVERAGNFAEAVRLGADYASLCPGPDSQTFLIDRINNFVADRESRRDFAGALAAAGAAVAAYPGERRAVELARRAAYNRAVSLTQAGDWSGAFEAALVLAAAAPDDASAAALVGSSLSGLAESYARRGEYERARAAVSERAARAGPAAAAAAQALVGQLELVAAVNDLPFDSAILAADRIYAAKEVGPARYAQALEAIYGNQAGRLGAAGEWLKASDLAERGLAKLQASKAPSDGSLERIDQTLRRNFVVEAHNRFARLYNAGDYAGAKAAVAAALASMPGDPTLTRDLSTSDPR